MKRDKLNMDIAHRVAKESYCERKKVGAIITKRGRTISSGWNGQPRGFTNCCEEGDKTYDTVIHAEVNAIYAAAYDGISTVGTTLYVTVSPCPICAVAIIQSGIMEVVYDEEYRKSEGINILRKGGVHVRCIRENRSTD